jgi:hypothetical protein
MSSRAKTRKEEMLEMLNEYIAEHGGAPADPVDVFHWARRQGRWQPAPADLAKQFKAELARAAREDTYTDPQGRQVRKKHAVVLKEGETQQVLWADIDSAPREHMQLSLQQRRRGMLGDAVQLKTDMDSYNENNNPGPPIQLSLNFDACLDEMREDTTYDDSPPDDDDDD